MATSNSAKIIEATDNPELIRLMDYPDSTEEIPTIDISGYLSGKPGELERVAAKLREVTETIGFFYLAGHGVERSVFDDMFASAKRFFDQPLEEKKTVGRDGRIGFFELQDRERDGNQYLVQKTTAPYNESFIIGRERAPDDADALAGKPFCKFNLWPKNLPGFRESVVDYQNRMIALGRKMLPLWARSLDLPLDFFDAMFEKPHANIRVVHYPPQKDVGTGVYGSIPHTDNCFMTLLAQANVPGLAVRMPSGHWRIADIIPGTIIVNTGNLMVRWTNARYLSTKHRVINKSGADRYTFPVFFGPDFETMIECLPTCQSPDNPPMFEPITYAGMRNWYYGLK